MIKKYSGSGKAEVAGGSNQVTLLNYVPDAADAIVIDEGVFHMNIEPVSGGNYLWGTGKTASCPTSTLSASVK